MSKLNDQDTSEDSQHTDIHRTNPDRFTKARVPEIEIQSIDAMWSNEHKVYDKLKNELAELKMKEELNCIESQTKIETEI
ncbi:hypothetical protein C6P45_003768 [Maudiozyma exigua]|uniref:Uncharacterized protein n=1 Tax=Maudiozyma exigua TaxID=34358 RepID=A0A9P6WBC2_MAUEX|nr:hypothetical protein C6P45_003768 [Kazachstania exigua]